MVEQRGLPDGRKKVAGGDNVSRRNFGPDLPGTGEVELRNRHAPGNESAFLFQKRGERPADAVDDASRESRAEEDGKRPARPFDGLADAKPLRVFVHLDERFLSLHPDDFSQQTEVSDADQLPHRHIPGPEGADDGAVDADDAAFGCHFPAPVTEWP